MSRVPVKDLLTARRQATAHANVAWVWLHAGLSAAHDDSEKNRAEFAAAGRQLEQYITANPGAPFERLASSMALTGFEHDLLLFCWLADRWPEEVTQLIAPLQPSRNSPCVSFALAFDLFSSDDRASMLPNRPLRQFRLIEINQSPEQGLSSASVRADEHVVAFADGEVGDDEGPRLDSMLMLYVRPAIRSETESLANSHRHTADALAKRWATGATHTPTGELTCLHGIDTRGKLDIAAAAARMSGRSLWTLFARQLPTLPSDIDTLAMLWKRDSLLYPLALFIDGDSDEPVGETSGLRRVALERLLGQVTGLGPVVLASRETSHVGAGTINVDVEKPKRFEQLELWVNRLTPALGTDAVATGRSLAWQFNLDSRTICRIVDEQMGLLIFKDDGSSAMTARQHLWTACRHATRPVIEGLAQRVDVRAKLTDVVLSPEKTELLRKIAAQVNARTRVYHDWGFASRTTRGLGIAVLFAGKSGTGKTMAAEALAAELDLDLYRIDLASVVSKYIGETERNLRRLFDAAEDGGAILFFDEADALFGKRSEVKDSHDRYSNIEVNYLLQRMESYRGLAILATNMKSALDPAFLRRLRFTVDFPSPSLADRKRIWAKAFPEAMLDDLGRPNLDLDQLAKLDLVGGNIHSIALNAAFIAADESRKLTTELVLEVAREELVKLDKHVRPDFFTVAVANHKPAPTEPAVLGVV